MLINTKISQLLRSLHDGEHINVGTRIVENVKTGLAGIPQLTADWNAYEGVVHHENLMFKVSKSSPETQAISDADRGRDALFRETKHRLLFYLDDEDAAIKHAAGELYNVLKPYDRAAKQNLFEESKFVENFIKDINKPVNAQHIALVPGLGPMLAKLDTLNNRVADLYDQRIKTLNELAALGKRAYVRRDADRTLISLLEAINVVHRYNSMGAPDANIASKLESAASYINGLVDKLREILAKRGGKRKHKPGGTQKPDATNPAPPSAPPTDPNNPPTDPNNPPTDPNNPPTDPNNPPPPPHNPDDPDPPAVGEH
jgi:hypothetical protein